MAQVIVIGGGLSGLSAAHTVLERGGRVLLLERNALMGGNSTKATSGINGALTNTQIEQGVKDSRAAFLKDTALSASKGASEVPSDLARVLVQDSAPAVEWLQDKFELDLSILGRLGGHSFPRTHRGKERFPGMTITYALMEKFDEICEKEPHRARMLSKARATGLLTDANGAVNGVVYTKDGQTFQEEGIVIIASGGYGADFSPDSLLMKYRPDVGHLPTTNGEHCTGDGIKMAVAIGADVKDMTAVQVHPTGLVHPDEPDAKVKFLAAEALRGAGAILLDGDGNRFCNELGRRDYVSEQMVKNKGPFRLVLNSAAASSIEWHCKHYTGRGLMKHFKTGQDLAKDIGCSPAALDKTFQDYRKIASSEQDPFGRKFFDNSEKFVMNDYYYVALVTPVVHYTMGGLRMDPQSRVLNPNGQPIPGLFAAGEVMGGVHGLNRLGGSSLLDCVVYGRVSGASATSYLLQNASNPAARAGAVAGHLAGRGVNITFDPSGNGVSIDVRFGGAAGSAPAPGPVAAPGPIAAPAPAAVPAAPADGGKKVYTWEEVAKHNTEDDCWVVVNGEVLDVTEFMPDHPGGVKAIMLYAGRDATEEFNMLHKPTVVAKYAPEAIIGTIEGGAAPKKARAKL